MEIGPLQLLVIGFADPKLDGSVLGPLIDASDAGFIRIVDLLGVYKDADGSILAAEMSDLTEDEAMEYGAWVGALVGLGAGGRTVPRWEPSWVRCRPQTSTSTASMPMASEASRMTSRPVVPRCYSYWSIAGRSRSGMPHGLQAGFCWHRTS